MPVSSKGSFVCETGVISRLLWLAPLYFHEAEVLPVSSFYQLRGALFWARIISLSAFAGLKVWISALTERCIWLNGLNTVVILFPLPVLIKIMYIYWIFGNLIAAVAHKEVLGRGLAL